MLSGETAVGEYPVEAVADDGPIARAVEPHLDYRHEMPTRREPDVGRGHVQRGLRHRRGARRARDHRPDVHREDGVARSRACGRGARSSGCATSGSRVQQMALEWGVMPLAMPETTDVEELWTRSVGHLPRERHRRPRRPGRDHGGHGREHPGLDERDQGGYCVGEPMVPPRAPSFCLRASSGPGVASRADEPPFGRGAVSRCSGRASSCGLRARTWRCGRSGQQTGSHRHGRVVTGGMRCAPGRGTRRSRPSDRCGALNTA